MSRNLGTQTRRPADRRHLRTAITMLVLAVFVTFAGWYAWNIITQPGSASTGSDPTTATTCIPAVPTDAPAPADIRLNVYNATDRNGLASSAAGDAGARFRDRRRRERPVGQDGQRHRRGSSWSRQRGRGGSGRRAGARRGSSSTPARAEPWTWWSAMRSRHSLPLASPRHRPHLGRRCPLVRPAIVIPALYRSGGTG